MRDYTSTEERIVLSSRMAAVKKEISQRLQIFTYREKTWCCPVEVDNLTNPFLAEFTEHPDAPYVINLANSIVRSWMETPFVIFENEAVVGITRPQYAMIEHFSLGIRGAESVLEDPDREQAEVLYRRLAPLTKRHIAEEGERTVGRTEFRALEKDALFHAGGYQGHTVPDYSRLLENGLDGMLALIDRYAAENVRDQESADFYEANRIIIRGMSRWLETYAEKAAQLAEGGQVTDVQRRYYREIAENCGYVAHRKPRKLYQAVQLIWCLSLWDWVDCMGRMDQYLYPFYQSSKEEGDVISTEDSMVSIVFKIWENGSHNVTLSGQKPDGTDASNELSYLLLQILREIHDTHPRMSVRVHKNSPGEMLALAVQLWSEGMSDPTVVSDETVIKGLMQIGTPLEDALDYTMLGCQEIEIPGKSNFGCEDGQFNLAKLFEYAMNGGMSTSNPAVRVGPDTGRFEDFTCFEDFFSAFEIQLRYFVRIFCHLCDSGQEVRAANFAKLVKTPFTEGCLEKGKPHDAGGPIYNYGVVETAGLAAAADSFTAVKKLVFQEGKISRQRLVSALAANFEGYEKERQMLLNRAPKFGNDDQEADAMAARVLDLFWSECGKYRSIRGDVYTGACSLLSGGIGFGKKTGALPDGRFAGEPLGNSIGPRPGADKNGVSAMLNSVAKLPLEKGVGGTTLNVVLTTRMLSDPTLRTHIASTIRTYLLGGGQMAQITTANLEDLLDAKAHPERHGDLIVRIGGFSVQFVQLDESAQNEIISRYN
nr:pyruvate formate lyase family protein [uncultured Acetatifactor sp.]